ncbi:hypothetical protein c7_R309 [Megavirus courdo7]|uniref:Uncharacterized protein n=1 Tax=Megavirus courdo7 TaxID=1128135 RepID=H2EAF2_9VIRU|nr:hypothetical protein c7_R309 [Megavirus courdo7]
MKIKSCNNILIELNPLIYCLVILNII